MRILLANWRDPAHPSAGGAERYVEEVAKRWAGDGHDVTLFSSRFPGSAPTTESDGFRILRSGGRFSVYRRFAEYVAANRQWDAVIESVNTRPFFAHRLAPELPTMAIIHQLAREIWFHEVPLPAALVGRYVLEPSWLRRYRDARVVAVSDSTRGDLQRIGVPTVGVVPPAVTDPVVGSWPKETEPTLVFLGRLTPNKRPDAAVEAWRRVSEQLPGTKLWMLGDGPMRSSLEATSEDGLVMFGKVDEATKWQLLSRAHLLLVPSVREGWGIVVMEAAMAGIPSVGYRVPGLVDAIVDGDTGWLCDPNPVALAQASLRALADPALARVADRARARAGTFTWDAVAQRILTLAGETVAVS